MCARSSKKEITTQESSRMNIWERDQKDRKGGGREGLRGTRSERQKHTRGGLSTPSRTSAGLGTTVLDTAIARPIPTARYVHAGLGRPQSRGGANGRHQGKGLGGRSSAINLPLSGDIRGKRPLPSALYPPAPHVRRRSVARLSGHTGGLGAPQAVGLGAPPRVVVHSGGERIGMRDGRGISNAASSQRPPYDLKSMGCANSHSSVKN